MKEKIKLFIPYMPLCIIYIGLSAFSLTYLVLNLSKDYMSNTFMIINIILGLLLCCMIFKVTREIIIDYKNDLKNK